MYKVISNDTVIDVIDKLKCVKFLYQLNRITPTDRTNADGIIGSDNKTIYVLQGHKCPEGRSYKTVHIKEIDEQTFTELKEKIINKEVISTNVVLLTQVRKQKIEQLSNICNETIIEGLNVLLSDGMYHHFKLTIEDQINLTNIQYQMYTSNKNIIYHETGKVCQVYTREDMRKILNTVNEFKNHHTTYFNLLKYCINNMTDISNIQSIQYGVNLLSLNIPSNVRAVVKELYND